MTENSMPAPGDVNVAEAVPMMEAAAVAPVESEPPIMKTRSGSDKKPTARMQARIDNNLRTNTIQPNSEYMTQDGRIYFADEHGSWRRVKPAKKRGGYGKHVRKALLDEAEQMRKIRAHREAEAQANRETDALLAAGSKEVANA